LSVVGLKYADLMQCTISQKTTPVKRLTPKNQKNCADAAKLSKNLL